MKRKYTFLLMLSIVFTCTAVSQINTSISAFGGYSEDGLATSVNFQIYPGHVYKNFLEISLYAGFLNETETDYTIDLNIYSLNAGYHFRIKPLSSKDNRIVTTLGVGGIIGEEKLNKGTRELPDGALILTEDGLIYGGYGAMETDVFISDNFSVLARYTHFYHPNSNINQTKFFVAIGLKYQFI